MLERAFQLLDHPFLSRLGNLKTLIGLLVAAALFVTGLVVALAAVFSNAGWVPLLFIGAGVLVLLLVGIAALVSPRGSSDAAKQGPSPPLPTPEPPRRVGIQVDAEDSVVEDNLVVGYDEAYDLKLRGGSVARGNTAASQPEDLRSDLYGLLSEGERLQGTLKRTTFAAARLLGEQVDDWMVRVADRLRRAGRTELADRFQTDSPKLALEFVLHFGGGVLETRYMRSRLDEKVTSLREITRELQP